MYDALLEALMCGDTAVNCECFRSEYARMCQHNAISGKTGLEEQYEVRPKKQFVCFL